MGRMLGSVGKSQVTRVQFLFPTLANLIIHPVAAGRQ